MTSKLAPDMGAGTPGIPVSNFATIETISGIGVVFVLVCLLISLDRFINEGKLDWAPACVIEWGYLMEGTL